MKQVIYKYPLHNPVTELKAPYDAVPVLVGHQRGAQWPSVWMKHRAEFTDDECGVFTFRIKATGDILDGEYIGSSIDTDVGFFVWHIVMERPYRNTARLSKS